MWDDQWTGRGKPWDYDAGPPSSGPFAELFASTPNYRGIGVHWANQELFRWHFGPMFYRGRLQPGKVKVLVIGQEGAQDESLSHRSFTGGTGGRMQHLLTHLGITESYLFMNTFVYPIFGQYDAPLQPLAQDARSPIVKHRQAMFDAVVASNDLRLVIAVGRAAKESVATWVKSKGGSADPDHLENADGHRIGPKVRCIGVLHPGGAGKGGSTTAIIADFKRAIAQISTWVGADSGWLPVDPDGERLPAGAYKYSASPVPFRDLPFGVAWRLGNGGTSSNRRDGQTAIQLFSDDGKYNNQGQPVTYASLGPGDPEGYDPATSDLAYEPPRNDHTLYDQGPGPLAKLLQGGESGLDWPDFNALGLPGHRSFGFGPVARGLLQQPPILVLADQASTDDLLSFRALTGEAGQRLAGMLHAAGLDSHYGVLRTLPVDSMATSTTTVRSAVDNAKVRALLTEAMSRIKPSVVLAVGTQASRIASDLAPGSTPVVTMAAWSSSALADWKRALSDLSQLTYTKEHAASSTWDGSRCEIPRQHLPFGTLRWQSTSGDRAEMAKRNGQPSADYAKTVMPDWAANLAPATLNSADKAAVDSLK